MITAAHCVDYQSEEQTGPGGFGYFAIDRRGLATSWFEIDAMRSFGNRPGSDDIALLRLSDAVPSDVATPATLSYGPTGRGSEITIFGYGCTQRERQTGSGTKRSFSTIYDQSFNLCPGDSGGPVGLGQDGPVLLINSAYYTRSGKDIFAEPYRWRENIEAQIDEWTMEAEPPPVMVDELLCMGSSTYSEATILTEVSEGQVCSEQDSWLRIELDSGDLLSFEVEFNHQSGDIDISLHDRQLKRRALSQGVTNTENIEYRANASGTYYIKMYGYAGASNQVTVNYEIVPR